MEVSVSTSISLFLLVIFPVLVASNNETVISQDEVEALQEPQNEVVATELCDTEVGKYIDQRIELKLNSVISKTIF